MENISRIAKNSVFEIATYAARSLSLIIVPFLIARFAGAELLGEYVTLINLAALFVFLATVGLPNLLTREIARIREDISEVSQLLNSAICLVSLFSLITVAIMTIVGWLLGYSSLLLWALFLSGIALAIEANTLILSATFRGFEEMHWISLAAFISEIFFLIAILIIVPLNGRIDWLMGALLISRIISLGVTLKLYNYRFGQLKFDIDVTRWKSLLRKSTSFAANEAITIFQGRLGVLILSLIAGNAVVGMLEVIISLTMRINVLGRAVNDALYPFLSLEFKKQKQTFLTYSAHSIHLLLIPGVMLTTLFWLFGEDLLALYGEEFLVAAPALYLLAPLIPVRFVANTLAVTLSASDRQKTRALTNGISAVTNLILTLVLVPRLGLMGAVYAVVGMELVRVVCFIYFLRKEIFEIIKWRPFFAPLVGSILMYFSGVLFTMNTLMILSFSVFLYLLTILFIDWRNLEPLRLILTRRLP